jgi:hypothetical protein
VVSPPDDRKERDAMTTTKHPFDLAGTDLGRPYPVTITQARYAGTYEGGQWLAFPCEPGDLDRLCPAWDDSDVECLEFWTAADEARWPIGRARDPQAAYHDLLARLTSNG